ncbi:MAG TPA: GAF domain-containing SpoIIE family protein phosphatase, partial [Bacteroidota bacterium]|nr:GAF domain-containing SpoIIE family protein phosphatase [Bacteroidota bacterium]
TMIIVLMVIRDIIFLKRRKGTRRNFLIMLGLILTTAFSTLLARPLESSITTSFLTGIAVIMMFMNSFRLSWIVYLSRREKIFSIIYGLLLFGIFIGFDIISLSGTEINKAITFYSPILRTFISTVSIFATIYFGMTFVSTLFHLPTAEAFDRKTTEVSSLHNLSRLVTQVFDFNELVDSVTTMMLEVCEAKSSWLEIIKYPSTMHNPKGDSLSKRPIVEIEVVAMKNISREDTDAIITSGGTSIRSLVLDSRKPIVIDEVKIDKRTQHLSHLEQKFNSLVIVPLVSHDKVIGILYATKEMEFGFDRDDVDLISAFADQATVAIENSHLIEKSLERERLMREMMVAQEMQRKLLPQELPVLKEVDLEALSTPAFEVGGDYYDFMMLDEYHLGILVGDVSGKGVSAAFYMAEMKGIFQSLSKIYRSPKEFLTKAHEALLGSIDKRSFISLIYGVLDLRDGLMTIARAGHCPMIHVTRHSTRFIKPTGLGLGMGTAELFANTISQEQVKFSYGDTAIFYSDGLTEAHRKNGEEFGYDRLLELMQNVSGKSAVEVRDLIIMAVDQHMHHESPEDDLTLVVMKWMKQDH